MLYRAKLTPIGDDRKPKGPPFYSETTMTQWTFDSWKEDCDERETADIGRPIYRRELVLDLPVVFRNGLWVAL